MVGFSLGLIVNSFNQGIADMCTTKNMVVGMVDLYGSLAEVSVSKIAGRQGNNMLATIYYKTKRLA